MVRAGSAVVAHREAPRQALHVAGLCRPRGGVRFTGIGLAFGTGHVLHARHGQEVTEFRGVQDVACADLGHGAGFAVPDGYAAHRVAICLRRDRFGQVPGLE